jgi:hypothetical protein
MIGTSAIHRQDFVLSVDRDLNPTKYGALTYDLKEFLKKHCQNFVFQIEKTGESNVHIQGRVNLKVRKRCETFEKELRKVFPVSEFYRIGCTPTSSNCRNFDYVMKEETRIKGPWADRPIFMGRSVFKTSDLVPWHKEYKSIIDDYVEKYDYEFDYRTIHSIVDLEGHTMKTAFVKYLFFNYGDIVGLLDPFGTQAQNSNSIVKEGAKVIYLIDLPRSMAKWVENEKTGNSYWQYSDQCQSMFVLAERLKDGGPFKGTMYGDCQYMQMDPPLVLIFSNWPLQNYPGQNISADRLVERKLTKRDLTTFSSESWFDDVHKVQIPIRELDKDIL